MKTLIKELQIRIKELERDKYIDFEKKRILIRENSRILCRCQQLFLDALPKQKVFELDREFEKGGYDYDNF